MLGRTQSSIWQLFIALSVPRRGVSEANTISAPTRTKHLRLPFLGILAEKLYYRGFADGDLTVQQVSGIAIMASSTTTHPAFVELFRNKFQKFGPVYVYPIRDTTGLYKWKVAARLDKTFEFLLPDRSLQETTGGYSEAEFLSWIAGLIDSDGTINMSNSGSYIKLTISIHNNDKKLLLEAFNWLSQHEYNPSGPYRTLTKGKKTSLRQIRYKKDMWRIMVQGMGSAQRLLASLPLRHAEKVERKTLALNVRPGMKWRDVRTEILSLRRKIRRETRGFIQLASVSYKKKHRGKVLTSPSPVLNPRRTN